MRARSAALFAQLARRTAPTRPSGAGCRDELVRLHLPLVEHFARRFRNRGEPFDDLLQVGTIGLIKAIDRFDPERGVEFSTYATPTIVGEIKRHFRDRGWAIRVPRRLQELRLVDHHGDRRARPRSSAAPPPSPSSPQRVGVAEEEIIEGLESVERLLHAVPGRARTPATTARCRMIDVIGGDDEALEHVENRETIKPLLEALDPREKHILTLRFFRGHDPVADRRRDRHLPDARLPAAGPHARAAAGLARGRVAADAI